MAVKHEKIIIPDITAPNAGDYLVCADNLDLLKSLPSGIIDLVYIDPPFATGKKRVSPQGDAGPDGYDDFRETPQDYIPWIAPRLEGLWRVLSPAGNLVIHLDHRVIHYIRIWCDENFGV